MPPSRLVWSKKAADEYIEFLKRRTDVQAVRRCVSQHLLAVSDDLGLARKWEGPGNFYIYRFECRDGQTVLYMQTELEPLDDDRLSVLACNSIRL